ncbi:hypothetical protein Moror_10398 [Moniliophthora roreri MCA 2997]|uniref:Uncharacterized protein n=2 Tax=Moniliophthora roreri TaxID=221103 RepID=V2XE24_MONRO|nr:hypothetical protein Moror_10398 [Moniliophthora roreri MCA 2997]KAI3601309.1 hypothetical protein WG66_013296 [Moniliophthora roreri]
MFLPTTRGSAPDLIETASTAASNGYLVYGLILLTVTFIFAVRKYLRSRFPCLTVADLDEKEKILIEVHGRAPKVDDLPCYAREQEELARRLLELKDRACKIRIKSMKLDVTRAAVWKVYLGVHPQILSDLVTWHDDAEAFKLHVLIIINSFSRSYYRSQLSPTLVQVPFQSKSAMSDINHPVTSAFDAAGSPLSPIAPLFPPNSIISRPRQHSQRAYTLR